MGAQAYRLRRKRVLRAERRRAGQKLEQVAAVRGVRQLTERSLVRQPALSVRVLGVLSFGRFSDDRCVENENTQGSEIILRA